MCPSGFVEKSDAGSTDCAGSVCDAVTDKDACCEVKAKGDTRTCLSGFLKTSDADSTDWAGIVCDAVTDKDACCEVKAKGDTLTCLSGFLKTSRGKGGVRHAHVPERVRWSSWMERKAFRWLMMIGAPACCLLGPSLCLALPWSLGLICDSLSLSLALSLSLSPW